MRTLLNGCRLQGVAAPELRERQGHASKEYMQRLVHRKTVTCHLTGERTYDREVGVCYLKDGADIGEAVIAAGLARDCPRYSGGRYVGAEVVASRALPVPRYCR